MDVDSQEFDDFRSQAEEEVIIDEGSNDML